MKRKGKKAVTEASQATTCKEAGVKFPRNTQSSSLQVPRELICSGMDTGSAYRGRAVSSLYEGMAKTTPNRAAHATTLALLRSRLSGGGQA